MCLYENNELFNKHRSSHYRFSYAVVDDEEDDYETEQGPNENFGQLIVQLSLLLVKF